MSRDIAEMDAAIGETLRKLRKQRGMSMGAVANVVGITYQQIQKYEFGRNRVSARNLYVLARFFGVDITAFFDGMALAPPEPEMASMAAQLEHIARDRPDVAKELCALVIALAASHDLNRR